MITPTTTAAAIANTDTTVPILWPVSWVGSNNRGGVRRVEINPIEFPFFTNLVSPSPYPLNEASISTQDGDGGTIGATAMTSVSNDQEEADILARIKEYYNSEDSHHRRCFAVEGYKTDHLSEAFQSHAVGVQMVQRRWCKHSSVETWRLFLDISQTDRPGHGWGNELWLNFVQ